MPHCTKCGTAVADAAAFCPNCGQPQPPASAPASPAQTGLSENVAAALSYLFGWLTGLIFFLIDKRPYVRYHAAQSLVVFGALHILRIALGMVFGFGWMMGRHKGVLLPMAGWTSFAADWGLISLIGLVTFVLWVVCMIKAYQGERFRVPIAAEIAESFARS